MRPDPRESFEHALTSALAGEDRADGTAPLAREVSRTFLACANRGGKHLQLVDAELAWQDLCDAVAADRLGGAADRLALLGGVLRWADRMRPFSRMGTPVSTATAEGPGGAVEVAACLALRGRCADDAPRPADPTSALLAEVRALLPPTEAERVDRDRLRAAMARLDRLRCLAPCRGTLGLRAVMRYQVPEE